MHPRRSAALDAALWALAALVAIAVAFWSLSPPSGEPPPLSDKLVHFLAYTALGLSLLLAAVWAPARGDGRFAHAAMRVTIVTFLFGIGIELIQAPLPERDASVLDALANACGALTALVLWSLWRTGAASARRS